MRFLSLFSGVEAASEAWLPLGWTCVGVSEIEPFPCEVLKHHHADVPNLGDVRKITEEQIMALGQLDLVVFGSPCQDLSVAGKRKGLAGARSGLFLDAIRIVGYAREWGGCRFALWENVPGAFSSNKGGDFAAVVDLLSGLERGATTVPPKGWGNEGAAAGPEALVEWGTLDAQWFGVAQRRRRVFALADFGDWARRPPILLERQSVRGNSPPRRGAKEDVAGTLASCAGGGGFPGTDNALDGYVVPEQRPVLSAFGGNNTSGSIDVATALNACGTASGRLDFDSETFVVGALMASHGPEGHGGSGLTCSQSVEAGHIIPVIGFNARQDPDSWLDTSGPLDTDGCTQAIAFSCKDYAADATVELAPTMRAMGHAGSHANAGGQLAVAFFQTRGTNLDLGQEVTGTLGTNCDRAAGSAPCVAFAENSRAEVRLENGDGSIVGALSRGGGKPGPSYPVIAQHLRVRRLTPTECERLQAFRDGHTAILRGTKRKRPAKDGPRYKALGNSICVNVMRWIGQEIDFVWEHYQ